MKRGRLSAAHLCGVATGDKLAVAKFYVPKDAEIRAYLLQVVVNGIPSGAWEVLINPPP